MSIISNLVLGAVAGAISMTVTAIRLMVTYYKDKRDKKWIPVFILLSVMYLFTLADFKGIPTILLIASMFCSFIPKWFSKNVQYLRLGGLFGSMLVIPYDIMVKNYVGCGFAIFNVLMLTVSLCRWIHKERKAESYEN